MLDGDPAFAASTRDEIIREQEDSALDMMQEDPLAGRIDPSAVEEATRFLATKSSIGKKLTGKAGRGQVVPPVDWKLEGLNAQQHKAALPPYLSLSSHEMNIAARPISLTYEPHPET